MYGVVIAVSTRTGSAIDSHGLSLPYWIRPTMFAATPIAAPTRTTAGIASPFTRSHFLSAGRSYARR